MRLLNEQESREVAGGCCLTHYRPKYHFKKPSCKPAPVCAPKAAPVPECPAPAPAAPPAPTPD